MWSEFTNLKYHSWILVVSDTRLLAQIIWTIFFWQNTCTIVGNWQKFGKMNVRCWLHLKKMHSSYFSQNYEFIYFLKTSMTYMLYLFFVFRHPKKYFLRRIQSPSTPTNLLVARLLGRLYGAIKTSTDDSSLAFSKHLDDVLNNTTELSGLPTFSNLYWNLGVHEKVPNSVKYYASIRWL